MTNTNKKEKSILNDEDWEILLPGKEITLGRTTITLRPLTLASFSTLTSKTVYILNKIRDTKANSLMEEFKTPSGFSRIVGIIVKEAPEIVTALTGIPIVDVVRLPITKNIELMAEAWEINIQDQDTLAKNLRSVATMMNQLTGNLVAETLTTPTPNSETPYKP
jgi:hypothetical protein